ncbi:MAG: YabP/YqfC family sporulation protein [Lachnospiraceae bacterium]|uniref:YabP/YqfC family sporulation protein n=1 Tax=Parablautia sp. Marseille-Q6255 TaxID=3039593 RepID=UPI0024BCBAFC|nr:YabP/YqfC family sporulation protein [Parablautia sp. Marseille-Q6255]
MKKRPGQFMGSGLVRAMQLPEDVSKGTILVSMQGRERLAVENFKGISSYTDTQIRLITRQGKICVTGRHLKIESYSRDEIEISGIIDKLEYQ